MSSNQLPPDGKSSGRAPEKSNFMQTCDLLNQYLKGKVSIRDLSLGIGTNSEAAGKSDKSHSTTVDFLTNIEKLSKEPEMTSTDPIPQNSAIATSRTVEEATNAAASTSKETPKEPPKKGAAQMTIFYSGKIMVFDEFPADKARAVMLLASKGSTKSASGIFHTVKVDKFDQPSDGPVAVASAIAVDHPSPSTPPPPPPTPPDASNGSDMPIARRSSLRRFMAKRKDRATARAPYQVHNNPSPPSKNEGSPSKDEASSSKNEESSSKTNRDQIDLNFKL